ncbi:MAG: MATE family efflux transporter [Lachnospiraceae bacterium]|nr:MATE family efflux transporter [Lachnospiraceae bacterium]
MKDLTTGKPLKVIIMFAIPIIFGSIFQQFYNFADAKIVSAYVGTDAFAAVGATSVVSNTIIAFMNGLTQGFAIPIAISYGAKEEKNMRKLVAGTMKLTLATTVLVTACVLIAIPNILTALKTPDEIYDISLSYVRIILCGVVFCAIYNMCANTLRAVGDSKTPLYCLIASVIINVLLDLLFVGGFGLGMKGAAYATLVAQACCAIACLIIMFLRFRVLLPKKDEWHLNGSQYGTLITTGLSMGLMTCIVNLGTIVLQSAINSLGTVVVAAHTAARRVFDVLCVTLYCIGISMTTFVSQNLGARKPERVKQGVWVAIRLVTIITTVLIVICFVFGEAVFQWLTSSTDKELIDYAVMYSRISILFFYALGPLFILRCSLQGLGKRIIPILSSVVEMVIKVLSANFLVPLCGYVGVAFTEPISWVIMAVVLAVAFFTCDIKSLMQKEEALEIVTEET